MRRFSEYRTSYRNPACCAPARTGGGIQQRYRVRATFGNIGPNLVEVAPSVAESRPDLARDYLETTAVQVAEVGGGGHKAGPQRGQGRDTGAGRDTNGTHVGPPAGPPVEPWSGHKLGHQRGHRGHGRDTARTQAGTLAGPRLGHRWINPGTRRNSTRDSKSGPEQKDMSRRCACMSHTIRAYERMHFFQPPLPALWCMLAPQSGPEMFRDYLSNTHPFAQTCPIMLRDSQEIAILCSYPHSS